MDYKENFLQKLSQLNIPILSDCINANTKVTVIGVCNHKIE